MTNKQIYFILFLLLAWFWGMVMLIIGHFMPSGSRRIDCSLAEFHPDFTPAMRQACRKARQ